jgi:protein required for attachment to host cells
MRQKKKTTWIVVADGSRARILASEGAMTTMTLIEEKDCPAARKATKDLGTDRPGRSGASATPSRHAMEPRIDWHEQEKARFAGEMAKLLNLAARQRRFDALILVAPPRTLAEIDRHLDSGARSKVVNEIAKDLTRVPPGDLPSRLQPIIRA